MAESTYPNGLPHPPQALRNRIAIELGVLAVLTPSFLMFAPPIVHNNIMYVGLALFGFVLVQLNARETRERIWGPPNSPPFDRVRRCAINMSLLTIPPVLLFFILGVVGRTWKPWWMPWLEDGCPMFSLNFFAALCMYLPWALLQQTLFQFYLLGRLRALLPFASPLLLSVLNGCAYGLVHFQKPPVMVVTIIGGIFWSYSYHRDRYVIPIAISHALLGTTFYYWIYNHDLVEEVIRVMQN